MTLGEQYEKWQETRYEHLGDIGFADAIHGVMDFERWVIKLGEADSDMRDKMISDKYKKIVDQIDDYEWDATFEENDEDPSD